jgi:hypothetical protein
MKTKILKLNYFIEDLGFFRTYISPFKRVKLKWYFGKVAIGVPYFTPRKWVKGTDKLIHKAVLNFIQREESHNKRNPEYARIIKPYGEIYEQMKNRYYPVPKKIGFDFTRLGWKTKWTNTDYRFEWSPSLSFVFFKWQIVVTFVAPEMDHYWECWLYYTRDTDKTKTTEERLKQAREKFPCKWITHSKGIEEKICYWDLILKNKYNK